MKKPIAFTSPPIIFLLLLALTLYRIFALYHSHFDLYPDESQYWFWSLTPDWGYYSKPPMVAWLIGLTTSFCGETEFCIRLSSPLLHGVTAVCIYGIAWRLFKDRRIAGLSAVTYATLPAVSVSALFISTDVPFMLFWALALYGFVRAVESNGPRWWLLAGLAAGLGMLSKYTMLVFLPSALLCLACVPQYRKYFSQKGLYLAMLVTFLVYAPNLVWNIQHGFVSYLHTKDNANLQGALFHPGAMLEFIASQFGVFGPVLFTVLLMVVCNAARGKEIADQHRLLLSFILPFLLLITVIAFLSRAHANWAAPVYVAGSVLVVAWMMHHGWRTWLAVSLAIHLLAMVFCYHADAVKHAFHVPERKQTDIFRVVRGWKTMAEGVKQVHDAYPDTLLLTNDRKIMASLYYYIRPLPAMVKWNADGQVQDHFELTTTMADKQGRDFLLVVKPGQQGNILAYFEKIIKIKQLVTPIYENYAPEYEIYLLKGFKGY